jgi:hypothetical protein
VRSAALIMAAACSTAITATAPSRSAVEAALHLRTGAVLPVRIGGVAYRAKYLGVEVRGHRQYALIFKLEDQ